MTRPRSQLVSVDTTPYYHCIARCVRRAFLCGNDCYSGKCFDHRKPWLVERLAFLAEIIAIDIAAYAVMSNHYHLVLHLDPGRAILWSEEEVLFRWTRLYKGPRLIQQYMAGHSLTSAELVLVQAIVQQMRSKLCSISRFMACLNEYIARKANLEDRCTGRFWEGRFKSQALLDEAALLSCMAYVDLNPVRSGIATSLDASVYTSIYSRIKKISASNQKPVGKIKKYFTPRLMPLAENQNQIHTLSVIPFGLKDYLELVDWTGRITRADKKGRISTNTPRLLGSLGISEGQWRVLAIDMQKKYITMFNGMDSLAASENQAQHVVI